METTGDAICVECLRTDVQDRECAWAQRGNKTSLEIEGKTRLNAGLYTLATSSALPPACLHKGEEMVREDSVDQRKTVPGRR